MTQKDFEFIKRLKEEFFKQKRIQNSLNIIHSGEISGWETWWQIEFATFLSLHKGGHEWEREFPIPVDKRKEKAKDNIKVDFIIRPKNCTKDRYILLELKHNDSPKSCIKNMIGDINKVECAKGSAIDQRSFWCVGIHKKISKKHIKAICEEHKIEEYIYTKFIPNTDFAFTII